MRYEIDLKDVRTSKQFHNKIQRVLPCPDYYGKNLDALYDILMEKGSEWELVFLGYDRFAHAMPGYGLALKKMCEDILLECPNIKISFE